MYFSELVFHQTDKIYAFFSAKNLIVNFVFVHIKLMYLVRNMMLLNRAADETALRNKPA